MRWLSRVLPVVVIVATAGCAAKRQLPADQYFKQASEDFRAGAFTPAIEGFRELLDQHPFSEYTEEVELKIAHAQYLDGDYISAIVAFSDFQRRYPTSPYLPFVGYMLGMGYTKQMGTTDRDQTAAQNAHAYFTTIINQYPQSPFAELARAQLAACRESLAEHELLVAQYYEHRGNPRAAEIRRLLMAAEYGETPSGADALLALARDYTDWHNPQHASLALRALEKLHPGSAQEKKARELVDAKTEAALPPTSDPIDLLLIANGRTKPNAAYGIPELPRTRDARPGPGPGAAMPPMDPFGRGGVGY